MAGPAGRQRPDFYARQAKARGAPARSVFKLEEMDQRWRLFRPGQKVLELGAAPGSWLQYVAGRVGPKGHVFAYDLQPLRIGVPANATFAIADVYELTPAWPALDVVLSDMAPSTMGHHQTDALRSAALAEHAMQFAIHHGAPRSTLVVKVLEGGEVPALARAFLHHYRKLERLRPKATRKQSSELFLIGLDKKA